MNEFDQSDHEGVLSKVNTQVGVVDDFFLKFFLKFFFIFTGVTAYLRAKDQPHQHGYSLCKGHEENNHVMTKREIKLTN